MFCCTTSLVTQLNPSLVFGSRLGAGYNLMRACALRACVYSLADPLGAEKEEQLVAILVEVCAGDQHRAPDVEAGKRIVALRTRQAAPVREPVVGVERGTATIEIALAVKLRTT